jgi:hypothetical protein
MAKSQKEARRGYTNVGREIFAVNTQALTAIRKQNLDKKNAIPKVPKPITPNLMPRDD